MEKISLYGIKVNKKEKVITGDNPIMIFTATNGYCDMGGHGTVSGIRIGWAFNGPSDIKIKVHDFTDDWQGPAIDIKFRGDNELQSMIKALRFAADSLEESAIAEMAGDSDGK